MMFEKITTCQVTGGPIKRALAEMSGVRHIREKLEDAYVKLVFPGRNDLHFGELSRSQERDLYCIAEHLPHLLTEPTTQMQEIDPRGLYPTQVYFLLNWFEQEVFGEDGLERRVRNFAPNLLNLFFDETPSAGEIISEAFPRIRDKTFILRPGYEHPQESQFLDAENPEHPGANWCFEQSYLVESEDLGIVPSTAVWDGLHILHKKQAWLLSSMLQEVGAEHLEVRGPFVKRQGVPKQVNYARIQILNTTAEPPYRL